MFSSTSRDVWTKTGHSLSYDGQQQQEQQQNPDLLTPEGDTSARRTDGSVPGCAANFQVV